MGSSFFIKKNPLLFLLLGAVHLSYFVWLVGLASKAFYVLKCESAFHLWFDDLCLRRDFAVDVALNIRKSVSQSVFTLSKTFNGNAVLQSV